MPRYYDDMGNDVTNHVQSLERENEKLRRENETLKRETGDLEAKIRKSERQVKKEGGKKQDALRR